MEKKILFIQPYYFSGGHPFQSFNNLILNLLKYNNYDFLVSINNYLKEKNFLNDFNIINKKKNIFTYNSSPKSSSNLNVYKAFLKTFIMRKKYDVFFYYDVNLNITSFLYVLFNIFFKKKIIIIYVLFGPEKIFQSKVRLYFFKLFLRLNNTKIVTRTTELEKSWKKSFKNFKWKINHIPPIDFPKVNNLKNLKKGNLNFGSVGQIRFGKSLEFLNSFFKKNKKYNFSIIGGYANKQSKESFSFLEKKFLVSNKTFLSFNRMIKAASRLDYIILLYDKFFDKRNEISTLYLAAKLEIPIICFKNNSWLHKQLKIYKCGYSIKSLKQFSNFPKRNSKKYKSYIAGLKKLNKNVLQIKVNQRKMEKILFS